MDLHKPSLELLRTQIKSSTSSMTSVPKPLKFLRQHYATMKELFETWPNQENKVEEDIFSNHSQQNRIIEFKSTKKEISLCNSIQIMNVYECNGKNIFMR